MMHAALHAEIIMLCGVAASIAQDMKKCDDESVYFLESFALRLPGELDWVEGPIVEGRLLCKGCDKKLLLTTIGKHVEKIHCVSTKHWLCVKDANIANNIAMGRPVVASANNFERAWNAHVMEKEKFEEVHLDARLHFKKHIAQHIANVIYFGMGLKPICADCIQWPTLPKQDCVVLPALRFLHITDLIEH